MSTDVSDPVHVSPAVPYSLYNSYGRKKSKEFLQCGANTAILMVRTKELPKMNPFGKQQTFETIQANNELWRVLHTTQKTTEQVDAEMAAYWAEKEAKAARRASKVAV